MAFFESPALRELAAGRPRQPKLDAIGRRVYRADQEPRKDMGPQVHPSVRAAMQRLRGPVVQPQENDTNTLRALLARRQAGGL